MFASVGISITWTADSSDLLMPRFTLLTAVLMSAYVRLLTFRA